MVEAAQDSQYADTGTYERLDELYQDYFRFGAACEAISHWNDRGKEIGNPAKEELLSSVFNSITCGNELKPAYNFDSESETLVKIDSAATKMLDWVVQHDMRMRGRTLLWHSQVNPAIFAKDYQAYADGKLTWSDSAKLDEECLVDRESLLARMKTYIYGVMEYTYKNGYARNIYAWDVVNEAADEGNEDGLRRSYWYQIIGPDYLYYAFMYENGIVWNFYHARAGVEAPRSSFVRRVYFDVDGEPMLDVLEELDLPVQLRQVEGRIQCRHL